MIISPIFYMGNKKKLVTKGLIDLFPKDINTFYDIFAGSAVVSMNVKANKYIVNDYDNNLYDLYSLLKNNSPDEIISHIENNINTYGLARERTKRNTFDDKDKIEEYKQAYFKLRKHYNQTKDVLDFYTLMFYSFSQQFRFNSKNEFNMPCGNDCFSEKNKEYILIGTEFFSNDKVEIYNLDYNNINFDLLNSNDFVYLDPPYLNTTATYNENNGWNIQDEDKLYFLCKKLDYKNIKWAMSNVLLNKGLENQKLKDWCDKSKWNIFNFASHTYSACGKGNSNTSEILITNY